VLVAGGEGFEAEKQAELPTPKMQPGETLANDRIRLSAAARLHPEPTYSRLPRIAFTLDRIALSLPSIWRYMLRSCLWQIGSFLIHEI
jgi:hypothetical protein